MNTTGHSRGADLGNDCFQFRFNKEEDVKEVLRNRPYQFGRWMIIVQRWEPIISQSFPAQIPFWISPKGIPLHYWHEKVVRDIGLELGELETYEVTKTTARIRVVVDGLQPLIMEAAMDYKSGEESIISLEYENLGNHCSICYRLSHLQSQCPEKHIDSHMSRHASSQLQTTTTSPPHLSRHVSSQSQHADTRVSKAELPSSQMPFQQRVDRHGRPFGDRISDALFHPPAPRNKLAPATFRQSHQYTSRNSEEQNQVEYSSPPYTRRRLNDNKVDMTKRPTENVLATPPPYSGEPRHQYLLSKLPLLAPLSTPQGNQWDAT